MDGQKELVNRDFLLDSLINDAANDQEQRDYPYKKKMLQFLLLNGDNTLKEDDDAVKAYFENLIDGDATLFGYTFFLSSKSTFQYNWSYLRAQLDNYRDYLTAANRFISQMIVDANILVGNFRGKDGLTFIFNEVFLFCILRAEPFVKFGVVWDKFYKLGIMQNKGYDITVKLGDSTLLSYFKTYKDNGIDKPIEMTKHLLSNIGK